MQHTCPGLRSCESSWSSPLLSLASFHGSGREHVVASPGTWRTSGRRHSCSRAIRLADKAANPGAWGFFQSPITEHLPAVTKIWTIISQEHLCLEMMVSRGPRPTLTQGLDREVTIKRQSRVGCKLGMN
jgi:hypothetical protein